MSPLLIAVAIGSLISVALAVWAFFKARFQSKEVSDVLLKLNQLDEKSWKHEDRRSLENRLTAVETQLRLMEKFMGDLVHRDDTPDLDRLIEKRREGQRLSDDEALMFAKELDRLRKDPNYPLRPAVIVILAALVADHRRALKEFME